MNNDINRNYNNTNITIDTNEYMDIDDIMDTIMLNIRNENINNLVNDIIENIISTIEFENVYSKKTKVIFDDFIDIYYIPSIYDDNYYSNKNDIWWSELDYYNFNFIAKNEIIQTIREQEKNNNIHMSLREAMNYLYQP
jgi:hypothetical protein